MDEKVRVMAIDNSTDVCEMLEALIKCDPAFEWVGYVEDGFLALDKIGELKPDVILLDIIMPRLDGVAFLERLNKIYPSNKPKIIALSAVGDQELIRSLAKLGVDYYLLKPIDAPVLINRIKQVANESTAQASGKEANENSGSTQQKPKNDIEMHVARLLFQLGMPTHFKGYLYLKDVISMIIEEANLYTPITTLYMKTAQKHETTFPVVEAAIRYAIRQTWKKGDPVQRKKLFSSFSDLSEERVPTNALFITRIAEEIKVDRTRQ